MSVFIPSSLPSLWVVLTMPVVTVFCRAKGLPIATTNSPGLRSADLPRASTGSFSCRGTERQKVRGRSKTKGMTDGHLERRQAGKQRQVDVFTQVSNGLAHPSSKRFSRKSFQSVFVLKNQSLSFLLWQKRQRLQGAHRSYRIRTRRRSKWELLNKGSFYQDWMIFSHYKKNKGFSQWNSFTSDWYKVHI